MSDSNYPQPVEMEGVLSMKNLREVCLNIKADRVDPKLPAWITPSFSVEGKPTASFKAISHDKRYVIESSDLYLHGRTGLEG